MGEKPTDAALYFKVDRVITIGLRLPDGRVIEEAAAIRQVRGGALELELLGKGLPWGVVITAGSRAVITSKESWALAHCHAEILRTVSDKLVDIRITSEIDVKQRREFFRMDVAVVVEYTLPENQQLSAVEREWRERRYGGEDSGLVGELPPSRAGWGTVDAQVEQVNLSGGGVRIRTREQLSPGSIVHLKLYLPRTTLRPIHVVGSVVRTNEVMLTLGTGRAFATALKFMHIDEQDRENLIAFLFNEQRAMLQALTEREGL